MSKPITKADIIKKYTELNGEEPIWKDKSFSNMEKEETNEYMRIRRKVEMQRREDDESPQEIKESEPKQEPKQNLKKPLPFSDEDKLQLTNYTSNKIRRDEVPIKEEEQKEQKEDKFIEDYIRHHKITDQERLNYAIEHDEKFRVFLEMTGRMDSMYSGNQLGFVEKERIKVEKALKKEAKKDKGKFAKKQRIKEAKLKKKGKKIKKNSNNFNESIKELDIEPYRNKKLEKQGFILCMYLRKNSQGELRYVKMDEVGQIKVDGYVYHERDAMYRFGKKNDPLLVILEGSLIPVTKELLKENLGFDSAEAQKLIIKGIEQAEVVKSGGLEGMLNKTKTPPKWLIGVGLAVIIGIYAWMGGFS